MAGQSRRSGARSIRSRREPNLYLVAYDIADPARLRRVYQTMRGYGDHLQYSVFRCVLTERQLVRLKAELEALIDAKEDQVLFVLLGKLRSRTSWRAFALGQPLQHPERVTRVF